MAVSFYSLLPAVSSPRIPASFHYESRPADVAARYKVLNGARALSLFLFPFSLFFLYLVFFALCAEIARLSPIVRRATHNARNNTRGPDRPMKTWLI